MKRIIKILIPLFLLTHTAAILSSCCDLGCCEKFCEMDWDKCEECCISGHPYFNPRPQHWNLARTQSGWQPMFYSYQKDDWSLALAITPEYTRSIRQERVARFFFGDDLQCGKLTVSGSRKGYPHYEARTEHEWLADYFGLSPDFQSTVQFAPRGYNFITDFSIHIGMDDFRKGLFLDINMPVVHTSRAMHMCETFTDASAEFVLGFDAGYMAEKAIGRDDLPSSFKAAMQGYRWGGDLVEPLKYGKISPKKLSKLRLADLRITLGCNLMNDVDYQCSLMVFGGIPTGNKPCAEYLFEPIAGNGGHFELGAGVSIYNHLWTHETEEKAISLYLDARVAHLFKKEQLRSFDLKNKANSRYMLVQEMKTPVENLFGIEEELPYPAPSHQYAGKLFPLINKTTCCTNVSIAAQGEFAATVKYTHGNFAWDLGYNFWGRSGEKLCNICCLLEKDKYALKGDAFVIGFENNTTTPRPLSATESKADIHAGTNTPIGTAFMVSAQSTSHIRNPNIDNPLSAFDGTAGIYYAPNSDAGLQKTSVDPVLLKPEDIDTKKTPSATSHKFFTHFQYAWANRESSRVPFLGAGGEIEFAGRTSGDYSTFSQWGVWVKGGVSFE